jgi:gliding motility-associated-like protein
VTGGTPPYSYNWTIPGAGNTPTVTNVPGGNYLLTVTDANGCTTAQPFAVSAPQPLVVTLLNQINVACFGQATGSALIGVTGGTQPYSISWNTIPPASGPIVLNLPAGTYTATVVDANGCSGSATVEITQPAAPLAINTIATNAPTCNGFNDGGIETIATGGTAPYTYTWNTVPPLNTPAVTGLAGGTYTLTVVDANGCTTTQLYDLSEPDAIAIQITNVQQVLCFGGATGSATIQASGGTAPFTIQWNDPLSQTGNTATALTAGIYTATVTDANGCVASVQVQITQPQAPLSTTIDPVQNVNCTGDATGQATVNITGGSGSYTIQWNDPAGQQTATASNLAAGTYTVTITDNNGCDVPLVLTVEITEPDDALQVQITPSLFAGGFNISCAGDSTGTLAITITGGTGPYSVLWDLPGLDTSTDLFLSDLKAGTYAVLITDANGCTAFASIALTEPDPISITFETTPSQCFGIPGGSISIQIFGGVPAYGVEWTAPDGSSAGSALQLIDIVGGSYLLTIQDANGCEYLDAVTVVQPEDIAITVDALSDFNGFNTRCSNSSDGSIEISVTGGTGTYSYQWNRPGFPNYSNQQDVFGIPAATHEVVVTDGNGCVQNLFITLTAPAPITVAFDAGLYDNGLNISCFGANDGSVEATASGGTPGYTYVWIGEGGFGPVFQNPITNLGPGEYSVLVIDANNCNFTSSVTLTGPPPFTITLQPTVNNGNNVGCAGGATGSINLITNGGAAPFTYSWTGPDGFMSSNEDLFNLPAGTYCVVVTDATFCTAQACVTLTEAPPLTLTLTPAVLPNGFNVGCGESNGSITTTVTGGTAAFTYNWTGPGNFTAFTPNISGLQAGTYCLTLTDANGCTTSECVTLSQPANVAVAINLTQPISCFGVFNGALAATVLQGEAPFSYFWTGPSGFTSLNQSISGLAPGTYCVQVTDVNGCTGNACFNLTPPPPIQVLISPSDLPGGFGVTCFGSQDGFALASVVGGTQPYQFAWTGPNGFTATTQALTQLGAGTYCLDVTDATGCAAPQACVTLAEPPAIQADPTISLPTCGDGSPAIVNLNVTQGTPPYLYLWSNGGTTASQTLGTGEYTVLITDDNGCQITEVITIEVPEVLVISLISPVVPGGVNIGCTGDATGSISLSVSGAQGNFTVSWTGPDGFSSSNQNLTNLAAGTYCATVTDDAGCEANACITLTEPLPVTATLNINDAVCADANNGSITALPSGGVPTYFISWTGPGSFTASGPTISGLAPGTYCALITDANNCTSTICGDINEPTAVNVTLDSPTTNGVNVACAGASTGSITSTPSGGTGTYTYNWTGPNGFNSTEQNPAGLSAGTYCVVVTDQNGCTAQACITLTEADPIVVDASIFVYPNGFNVSCAGSCDGSLAVSFTGGQEPIDAQWSGPAGFTATGTTLNDLCVGTYTLTTTDGNGCVQVETITITAPPSIVLSLSSPTFGGGTEISCFGAANGTINTFISGGVPGYTFSWSGPGGFTSSVQNPDNLGPGTYTVMVTDATNCTATEQITLNEPETALTATATAATFPSGTNISCAGSNDGSITTTPVGGTPPYSYNWLGPNNFNSTNQNISGLAPGEYVLVVQDANSCVFTVEVTLTAPLTPVTATATTLTPVLCAGATTGAIQVAGEGGSGTYTVLWIGPNGFTSNAFAIENLPAGTYTYALSDENSCTVSGAVTLNEGPQLELTADVTNAQCDAANGAIAINVTNGTEPIIYAWSTGASDAAISGLPAGVYTVLVTDANGCQASGQYEVGSTNSLELVVSTTEPNCHGEMSGSIQTSVVSGAQPISFAWSGPNEFTSSEEDPFNLMAGTYSLFALDANGCITELEVTLNQPEPLEISPLVSPLYLNGFNVTTFGGSDGSINAPQVSGGTTPYDYFWTGPNGFLFEGDGALGGLSAGTYRLAVVDARLCSDTAFITLREPVPLELPNGISPNGDGFNDGLIVRGLDDFPENTLYVYNRWGNLLYEERNYRNQTPWIGTNNSGEMLPEGTYFVVVVLPNRDDLRGYLELRR